MSDVDLHNKESVNTSSSEVKTELNPKRKKSLLEKILRIIAICFLCIIGFILILLTSLSLFLTPERLTELVNTEAGKYIEADIHADYISYSVWSSFPRLDIHTDSIKIISRTLNSLSEKELKTLPANAKDLASARSFEGSINIVDLFLNRYVIHDIKIEGLNINLVVYNDSINNYDIIPSSSDKMKRIPYISAESVEIHNQGKINYFYKSGNTSASVDLKELSLNRRHGKDSKELYHLSITGKINASSGGLTFMKGFPFNLSGDLRMKFDPFRLEIIDYGINLGELKSQLSMSFGMGEDPKIESLEYKISSINLMRLLGYIPKEFMPSLEGIHSDMTISASAHLMSAWDLTSNVFPSVRIDFSTPAGELTYQLALNSQDNNNPANTRIINYPLQYSDIAGSFFFNGKNPDKSYIEIPEFTVATDGVSVGIKAKAVDLTSSPLFNATVNVNSDLKKAMTLLPDKLPLLVAGNLNVNSNISFNLQSLSQEGLQKGLYNIRAEGDVKLTDCIMKMNSPDLNSHIQNLNIHFFENAGSLTPDYLESAEAGINIKIDNISGKSQKGDFNLSGLNFQTRTHVDGKITPQQLLKGIPLDLVLDINKLTFVDPQDNLKMLLSDVELEDKIFKSGKHSLSDMLSDGFNLKSDKIIIKQDKNTFIVHQPDLSISLCERNNLLKTSAKKVSDSGIDAGSASISGNPTPAHTPELISFSTPEGLRNFMNAYSLKTNLKAERIDLLTPGGDKDNNISNIDIALDDDSFCIKSASMMLEKTKGHLNGRIGNIRNFLLLPPAINNPIDISLNVDLDTININSLAHTYALAKGGIDKIQTKTQVQPDDSIAILIPRNIKANIDATAKETIYMNLHLNDLATKINITDGTAYIPDLKISTDFGNASLNMRYDTSDLFNLNFKLGANLDDINITNFFKNFRALLNMMPEMKNLTGMLSIGVDGSGRIFPDMSLNMPSVVAGLDISGRNLKVHQSKFIRKITKMMLIRTDEDIHIKDIDVHAGIHDNLLQLDPFDFEFDRYKLHMLGINNFNGKLYYHLAVMESPVPFPFSINIEGMFHKPKLRFGGAHYDVKRGEEVTAQIQESNNINLVAIMRSFMGAFIKKAAESAVDPNLTL